MAPTEEWAVETGLLADVTTGTIVVLVLTLVCVIGVVLFSPKPALDIVVQREDVFVDDAE